MVPIELLRFSRLARKKGKNHRDCMAVFQDAVAAAAVKMREIMAYFNSFWYNERV